jgi:putative membrane protein
MKLFAWFAALAGGALFIGLVIHEGAAEVAAILASAGWALLWLLPAHAVPLLFDVMGWRALLGRIDPSRRANLAYLYWIAVVREAVNRLLPTANIGGDLVGIRLARVRIPDTAGVAASVIFEMLLTLISQYLFVVLGVILFLLTVRGGEHGLALLLGLVLGVLPIVALGWVLRHGALFGRIEQLARRILGANHHLLTHIDGDRLDTAIREFYYHPFVLIQALSWQLAGFLLGSIETWLALRLFGEPVSPGTALALEAMTQATRILLFMVPVGLGVQEAGVILFAGLAGVTGGTALSVALARRMREILFGVPGLVSWQWFEATQLRRAHRARCAEAGAPIREKAKALRRG